MRKDDLLDAVGSIGEDLIEDAASVEDTPRWWMKWGSIAVCLGCVALGLGLLLAGAPRQQGSAASESSAGAAETAPETAAQTREPETEPQRSAARRGPVYGMLPVSHYMVPVGDRIYFCDGESVLYIEPDTGTAYRLFEWSGILMETSAGLCGVDTGESGDRQVIAIAGDTSTALGVIPEEAELLDVLEGKLYWYRSVYQWEGTEPQTESYIREVGRTDMETGRTEVLFSPDAAIAGGRIVDDVFYYQYEEQEGIWRYELGIGQQCQTDFPLEGLPPMAEMESAVFYEDFVLLPFKVAGDSAQSILPEYYLYKCEYDGEAKLLMRGNTTMESLGRWEQKLYGSGYTPILWSGGNTNLSVLDLETGEYRVLMDTTNTLSPTELMVCDSGIYYSEPYVGGGLYRFDPETGNSTLIY